MNLEDKNKLGEATEKVPELKDKKNLLIIGIVGVILSMIGIMAILTLAIVIVFAPLEKGKQLLDSVNQEVKDTLEDAKEKYEDFYERYINLIHLKGFYNDQELMEKNEAKFYRKIEDLKDCEDGISKEKATSLILATLFYDGDYNKTLRDKTTDPKEEEESSTSEEQLSDEEKEQRDYEKATKQVLPLYNEACKGGVSYKKYLVEKYIPDEYKEYLKIFKDETSKNNEIVKIADEIMSTTNEYLVFTIGQGVGDTRVSPIITGGGVIPITLGSNCQTPSSVLQQLGNPFGDGTWCNQTSCYGVYGTNPGKFCCGSHSGVDIVNGFGSPVYAMADGKVIAAQYINFSGKSNSQGGNGANYVIISSTIQGHTITQKYWHLNTVEVDYLEDVKKGQRIGTQGNTGDSFGSHLHLGLIDESNNTCNGEIVLQSVGCSTIATCSQDRNTCSTEQGYRNACLK